MTRHDRVAMGLALALGTAWTAAGQEPPDSPKLALYAQTSLAGDSRSIQANFSNLEAIDFDNRARSVRVLSGTWEICEEKNYKKCQVVERNVLNLDTTGLSGKISSVRIVHTTPAQTLATPVVPVAAAASGPEPTLVLFDKTNYRGATYTVTAPAGNVAGLTARVESLKVVSGTWQVCTGMNYTGTCTTIAADSADLGRWRNTIVSARPITPGAPPPQQ
jgi:hypothetical protein